ncbi:MAG: hypothetical protein LAT83_22410, partial [Kiritimatiellae bacterium]|nr:hypothetical protein [Kiritimatiellia bacterium]
AENHSPDDKTQADFEARALAKSAGLRTFEMPLKLVPFGAELCPKLCRELCRWQTPDLKLLDILGKDS